ncbi:WecB/TagA/CpsF family glycosyltransferase [Virgibacillus halodenitrificans]|uniref:WecB/TagA/CpsF family glycosyltransferase n=1 Tax=Virgibacillus halodenitrificans TaxID=1482 RepID=UPI001F42B662|nr:WecB/TagA/CpsF family glycosyltransferase [Virgibacillus halodenitrificans]MEC2158545.1 WecB/TagA/CpsF family glycosyltransferase [Virgibacillus halodenitrificans]
MRDNETVKIMDVNFLNCSKKEFLHDYLVPDLKNNRQKMIVTANPEIVMRVREDNNYKQIVNKADYVIPDGAGIIIASRILKQPLKERVPGYELMIDMLEFAGEQGYSCYFLGAKKDVNEKAVLEAKKRFPNLKVAGQHHGFFDIEDEEFARKIAEAEPDMIFVALGLPRQEQWINRHREKFSNGIFMGIGGSFDVLAGEVKRAPQAWINLNLEWLYRLLQQPFRFKRILKVFEFMIRVIIRK